MGEPPPGVKPAEVVRAAMKEFRAGVYIFLKEAIRSP